MVFFSSVFESLAGAPEFEPFFTFVIGEEGSTVCAVSLQLAEKWPQTFFAD